MIEGLSLSNNPKSTSVSQLYVSLIASHHVKFSGVYLH